MHAKINVSETIHYIGANDRTTPLFENIWPLPQGVSYNSYLITDEKCALLDTVKLGFGADFIEKIEEILGNRQLDYLIINHMEPDHSGEVESVIRRYPGVKIVGNVKTFKVVESYFGIRENLLEVKDGDTLPLGRHTLRFVSTPWVHWPETMMTYDETDKVLFSGDAFGSFGTLDGGIFDDEVNFAYYESEMRRYYSNIVGKYSNMVQKALAKLAGTDISVICPLHGPVWRTDPQKVVGLYDRWSRYEAEDAVVIVYASMYGNTAQIADYIARKTAEAGMRDIRVYDVSKTHISYLISEIWRCKGVILGSCAYNGYMFPLMENLTRELTHLGLKDRYLGLFGSYSWNGGGMRNLQAFAETIGWEQVCDGVDLCGSPAADKIEACGNVGTNMAKKILHG